MPSNGFLPPLNIPGSAGNVLIFWPAYAAGFRHQSVTNPAAASNCTAVLGTPATIGNQLYVTNAINGAKTFYRLIFP